MENLFIVQYCELNGKQGGKLYWEKKGTSVMHWQLLLKLMNWQEDEVPTAAQALSEISGFHFVVNAWTLQKSWMKSTERIKEVAVCLFCLSSIFKLLQLILAFPFICWGVSMMTYGAVPISLLPIGATLRLLGRWTANLHTSLMLPLRLMLSYPNWLLRKQKNSLDLQTSLRVWMLLQTPFTVHRCDHHFIQELQVTTVADQNGVL